MIIIKFIFIIHFNCFVTYKVDNHKDFKGENVLESYMIALNRERLNLVFVF